MAVMVSEASLNKASIFWKMEAPWILFKVSMIFVTIASN